MYTEKYTKPRVVEIDLKVQKESFDLSPEQLCVLALIEQTEGGFNVVTTEVTLIRHIGLKLRDTVICK